MLTHRVVDGHEFVRRGLHEFAIDEELRGVGGRRPRKAGKPNHHSCLEHLAGGAHKMEYELVGSLLVGQNNFPLKKIKRESDETAKSGATELGPCLVGVRCFWARRRPWC
jgi:hypothetical protein